MILGVIFKVGAFVKKEGRYVSAGALFRWVGVVRRKSGIKGFSGAYVGAAGGGGDNIGGEVVGAAVRLQAKVCVQMQVGLWMGDLDLGRKEGCRWCRQGVHVSEQRWG